MSSEVQASLGEPALIRKTWMTVLALSGAEHRSWLQGMVTNDVEKLKTGEGCYAGHLNAQGKLVAQMVVLAEDDRLLLLVETAAAERLATAFDRLIVMEDVQVTDLSSTHEVLSLFGARSERVLESWAEGHSPLPELFSNTTVRDCNVVRNELGYDILAPRQDADRVFAALCGAGASAADRAVWELLRIEAGIPVYGIDLDETTILPELGGAGISYDKGCYIGQEVVARIKYLGHVNRRFVGFVCEGPELPQPRTAIQREGKDVGYFTSSIFSPRVGSVIALGFVNRFTAEPGTRVQWTAPQGSQEATIAALPFGPIRSAG